MSNLLPGHACRETWQLEGMRTGSSRQLVAPFWYQNEVQADGFYCRMWIQVEKAAQSIPKHVASQPHHTPYRRTQAVCVHKMGGLIMLAESPKSALARCGC